MKLFRNILFFIAFASPTAFAETFTFHQFLQQVLDHYPSAAITALEVEKAAQVNNEVESRLGWQLGVQGGVARNSALFGSLTDTVDVAGQLSKQLETGERLSISAGLSHDDASVSFNPTIPDPAISTRLNLNYLIPLEKGQGNLAYNLALDNADVAVSLSKAEQLRQYDLIAQQVIELYLMAINTLERINNMKQALERSQRLQAFIKDRLTLGLAEDKDSLQVNAQIHNQQATLAALQSVWVKQRIALNRLMGEDWRKERAPVIAQAKDMVNGDYDAWYQKAKQHSPLLLSLQGQLQVTENTIKLRRDERKDNLELQLFIGNTLLQGDSASGSRYDSDLTGGVRLDFSRGLDLRGHDAVLYQAEIDRGIVLQKRVQVLEDIHYGLVSVLATLDAEQYVIKAYQQSVDSEHAKLLDAEERYRAGRIDIDQVIQFESQLSAAELAFALQTIEMMRYRFQLSLLSGDLWQPIVLPILAVEDQLNQLENN